MIILSGVLVVLAIALLVAGIVAGADGVGGVEGLTLIYISIGISVVSALCLLIGVFLRRKELFGPTGAVVPAKAKAPKPGREARKAQEAKLAREAAGTPVPAETSGFGEVGAIPPAEPFEETLVVPAQPVDVPPDAPVFVVHGRKRYHLESCRQLAGRDKEELTYEEAIEEGFSQCTACMPDTALAARAAVSVMETPSSTAESAYENRSFEPRSFDTSGFGPGGFGSGSSPYAQEPLSGTKHDEPTTGGREADRTLPDALSGGYGIPARPASYAPSTPAESDYEPSAPADYEPSAPAEADEAHEAEEGPAAEAEKPEPARGPITLEFAKTWPDLDDHVETKPEDTEPEDTEPEDTEVQPDHAAEAEDTPEDDKAQVAEAEQPEKPAEPEKPLVRILSGTKRYHRPDCALIEDIGDEADDLEALTREEAKDRGCTPCLVCQPDKEQPSN